MASHRPKVYHHSNVKETVVKIIVIIIAAAFILALTAFFGFRKFIAYTDTGKLYLDIPWLYGYMDGPPLQDDLAQYLAPVETSTPDDNTVTETPDDKPEEPAENKTTLTTENASATESEDSGEDPQ